MCFLKNKKLNLIGITIKLSFIEDFDTLYQSYFTCESWLNIFQTEPQATTNGTRPQVMLRLERSSSNERTTIDLADASVELLEAGGMLSFNVTQEKRVRHSRG